MSNGWPSGWQSISTYVDKLKARLPSTDVPSKDGKRYLTQIHDVIKSLLDKQGYSELTINNNPNAKDKVYGFTAFPVGIWFFLGLRSLTGYLDPRWKTNWPNGYIPENGQGSLQFQARDKY
jgi:hypothetical protein